MAVRGKADNKGRSSGKGSSKENRYINPPTEGGGRWVHLTEDILDTPVVMAISHNALKILVRLISEHSHHGRLENGQLRVSQQQFSDQCAIRYQSVPKAVRELEAVGLVAVTRQGRMQGRDMPNLYRLTFYGDHTLTAPPTNEWKRYRTMKEAEERIEVFEDRYQLMQGRTKKTPEKKADALPDNVTKLHTGQGESK